LLKVESIEAHRNLVGEVDVITCEIRRTPAVDGRTDVLCGSDDHHGNNQEQHGEVVVQSINHVVVVELVRFEHLSNRVH